MESGLHKSTVQRHKTQLTVEAYLHIRILILFRGLWPIFVQLQVRHGFDILKRLLKQKLNETKNMQHRPMWPANIFSVAF